MLFKELEIAVDTNSVPAGERDVFIDEEKVVDELFRFCPYNEVFIIVNNSHCLVPSRRLHNELRNETS